MFLKYYTREGHFNWSKPSEVSYSCNVAVYDDDANRIKYCNFTPEYELEGTDVHEAMAEIEESMSRYWSTSDDRKEMIAFLKENKLAIETGNVKRRLAVIDTELAALTEEKERLSSKVNI